MQMSIANELIKAVTSSSKGSSRSQQKQVGPSEIGGCRRKVWLKLQGAESTNPNTLRLAAIMGTAIHTYIEQAFERQDPFQERYILEGEYEYEGLMGHIDMYDKENCEVVDWKTVKKTNLTYFPSKQQRMQVQLYGYLLVKNNVEVKTVTLVAIPRDGDERDIVYHSEPYDESVALAGLAWLKEVEGMTEAPAPEKDAFFCQHYCNFYDKTGMVGCTGKGKDQAEGAIIEDEEVRSAAREYLNVTSEINELDKIKDSLKAMLEGVSGTTPEGIRVAWSEVSGRKSVDEAKVKELLGEVPLKYGNAYTKLTVKEG
jgi:hypothetical protein